ncbi:MAG: CoA pyrophosphatase [Pseudomonadota bacterium]
MTPDQIRRLFAGTTLEDATAGMVLPPGSDEWPQEWLDLVEGELRQAGVLVPLLQRDEGLTVLLTQRSAHLKHHASQVSFPGGSQESQDASIEATALRETHEEVGISPHFVTVAGYMPTMPTITGYAVTPIIGVLENPPELVIDRSEVDYAFEVPLEFLLDSRNDRAVERNVFGKNYVLTEFHWEGQRIWGATAYMILAFRELVLNQ